MCTTSFLWRRKLKLATIQKVSKLGWDDSKCTTTHLSITKTSNILQILHWYFANSCLSNLQFMNKQLPSNMPQNLLKLFKIKLYLKSSNSAAWQTEILKFVSTFILHPAFLPKLALLERVREGFHDCLVNTKVVRLHLLKVSGLWSAGLSHLPSFRELVLNPMNDGQEYSGGFHYFDSRVQKAWEVLAQQGWWRGPSHNLTGMQIGRRQLNIWPSLLQI